jgi:uncharacterized protein involved in exopolysaccharide biosynthesis
MDESSQRETGREVDAQLGFLDLATPLAEHVKLLLLLPLLAAALALGVAFAVAPTFTARTTLLPPQQQQSIAASALSSLGALAGLAGLAGGGAGVKSPAEQFVALMQSESITDRLIDDFKLLEVYDEKFRVLARKELLENVRFVVGKKDGLISIEVDDKDPRRAAAMATRFVEELRKLTSRLAISEAQQRRVFFERQLAQARDKLTGAQQALQASGFNSGAIKAEPKAAAEAYARLRAEAVAAEVRLQALRRAFSDHAPEVQHQLAALAALRAQLGKAEAAADTSGDADYISRYREFKYQETLFDLFARQYELARADESREGALIQVVDEAQVPERKSKPKRALVAALAWLVATVLACVLIWIHHSWRAMRLDPMNQRKLARLDSALGRR